MTSTEKEFYTALTQIKIIAACLRNVAKLEDALNYASEIIEIIEEIEGAKKYDKAEKN